MCLWACSFMPPPACVWCCTASALAHACLSTCLTDFYNHLLYVPQSFVKCTASDKYFLQIGYPVYRSLAACEQLYNAGYRNLFWVQGGLEAAEDEVWTTEMHGKFVFYHLKIRISSKERAKGKFFPVFHQLKLERSFLVKQNRKLITILLTEFFKGRSSTLHACWNRRGFWILWVCLMPEFFTRKP